MRKSIKSVVLMVTNETYTIEGYPVQRYIGIVTGEVIMGANVARDFLASITDIVGGRSGAYENKLQEARDAAFVEWKIEPCAWGQTPL
ncbi:hypothetical protein C172_16291 [Paenibacillus sp. FSL H8-457]|nr:hypothetical protein C172_16291 [Paenibacillus sp. FSL H8-457]